MTTDPLLAFRPRFPILDRTTYLISNSLGAMPTEAAEALASYAETWARRGVRAWSEGWWELALQTGDLLGPILGTGPGEVTFHQNVTVATAVVLSCHDLRPPRDTIVTTEMEFPSVRYLLDAVRGARVMSVPSRDGLGVRAADLCEAIDDRTAIAVFSHVLFGSSFIVDAAAVAAHARSAGALTLLDAFQSAGTMPVGLPALGVDACVGGCLKWLCGGPGNAFLWVRPDLDLEPRLTGWQAHERPFAFEPPPIRRRADGARFLTGTPNIPALYAAAPGLRIIAEAGATAIREKSVRQTGRLIALATEQGYTVRAPLDPESRGGTVAIDVPYGREVAAELNARDVCVDFRPGFGVRISPHLYTRDDELDDAVAQISEILRTRAYERHLGVAGTVT